MVTLGGGVVGDLGGFVAAIYKRGVPYVQIPTTLLAQVDSAIGGKTAIDLPLGKNLAGAFYQPKIVISDVAILRSLPKRRLRSAMAEIIKYGVIKDGRLFEYLEAEWMEYFLRKTCARRCRPIYIGAHRSGVVVCRHIFCQCQTDSRKRVPDDRYGLLSHTEAGRDFFPIGF